jgi:O-antigen/teichoic acid export membrane protein
MGTIKKQGFINTIISYLGIIIGFVNLLVFQPLMLSTEELGLTRILYSSTILLGTLFPIGLNFLTIRFFPTFKNKENGHNGYLGLLLLISVSSYLFFATLLFIFKDYFIANYSNAPIFIDYFYYIFPMSLFIGINTLLIGYSSALFKTTFPSFLNEIYIRLFATFITLLYFFEIIDFVWFMRLFLLSYGSQLAIMIFYLIKTDGFSFKINWTFFKKQNKKEIARYTIMLAFASLASIAIRNIDILFIGSFINLNAVAVYTIAFTIGSIIEAPVNALSKIADSKISDALTRNDMQLVKTVYFKSSKLLSILGGILFVGVCVNIHDVLSLLPSKYHGGEWVVIIIGISSLFNMATGVNTSLIYYSHLYKIGTRLLYIMIALTIILNLVLIPSLGIIGAAIGTGTALLLFNLMKFLVILKHYKLQPYGAYIFVVIGLIIACLANNYFLPQLDSPYISICLRSIAAVFIYSLGVFVFKLLPFNLKMLSFLRK